MKKIELLSPVGNLGCLRAAVQNGADAVYFGSNLFSARAFASNFDDDNLRQAISYAKLRGVQTHLTLNTLIKNDEFEDALQVAKKAYEYGIDAIIVQDLGLALYLIKNFPALPIHASTQMTAHNLDGVLELQELGFKRAVLSRELSLDEIKNIGENTDIEIETFIHGALCISYSGQCLFSSMVGGRSGNRGKCAQPCRLPYTLEDSNGNSFDKGYLLSPKDLCGLDFIPELIDSGVTSLKIEGRMKSPEYVSIVTKIYRKYIDLAYSNEPYIIDEIDRKMLALAFNRGGFSNGHLTENTNLIFKEKPNNMGLFLGKIKNYDSKKGLITLTLNENLSLGDSISLEKESNLYNVSELMINNKNQKDCIINDTVTIGRMKGNINIGDKVYKMSDKSLNSELRQSFKENAEIKKIPLNANITVALNKPVTLNITSNSDIEIYKNLDISVQSKIYPEQSQKSILDKEKIVSQISKIQNTPYEFTNINIDLEDNLFLPNSVLNELKRNAIEQVKLYALNNICRKHIDLNFVGADVPVRPNNNPEISVLLNILDKNKNYENLKNIDNIYVPLKYFVNKDYFEILHILANKFNLFIYLPTIMRNNYNRLFNDNINNILNTFNITGFVISNISGLHLLKNTENLNELKLIGNYTLNVYNYNTANSLNNLGLDTITISPELDYSGTKDLSDTCSNSELIVYGNIPVMNSNYCLFGKTNHCHQNCINNNGASRTPTPTCKSNIKYYLKDRMNFKFRLLSDNIDTVTTIYNSKTTSIEYKDFNLSSVRIDILDENIDEINNIVNTVKNGNRFEGNKYTSGNLNRNI